MDREILQYYEEFDEHNRIIGDSIERLRTQELISRFLCGDSLQILDVGGATGVYSFWLSSLGHHVHLVDASPKHIRQAIKISAASDHPMDSIAVKDARDLGFDDNVFDAVLLFGPMYHLTERPERLAALAEARRVMKSGAIIFAAVISRYASMIDGFLYDYVSDPDYVRVMMQDLENGQHRGVPKKNYFTSAFFHTPDELKSELEEAGFFDTKLYSVEGISELVPNLKERMKDTEYRSVLFAALRATEQAPAFMGMSAHSLGIATKPRDE